MSWPASRVPSAEGTTAQSTRDREGKKEARTRKKIGAGAKKAGRQQKDLGGSQSRTEEMRCVGSCRNVSCITAAVSLESLLREPMSHVSSCSCGAGNYRCCCVLS